MIETKLMSDGLLKELRIYAEGFSAETFSRVYVEALLGHIAALIAARESDRLEAAQTIADSEACITTLIVAYLRRCDYPILALCIAKGDWKK